MKKMTLDSILIFFYQNEIEINKKALSSLIKAFELNDYELMHLDASTKEYIAKTLFSVGELKTFYRLRGRERYFIEVLEKRVYNDNRR